MKLITVAAAAIVNTQNQVLLAQRPEGKNMAGLWEFPGGKLEAQEIPEDALCRELQEELGISVSPTDCQAIQFVSHEYDEFHLLMLLYGIRHWQGDIAAIEHKALEWAKADAFTDYPMPPADAPLLPALISFMEGT
jgi:8-oxo-dGTP diphosphatase